jgi:hypothetical protein
MKRRTLLNLWQAINKLEGLKHDVRFSYFLAKNKVALKPEIEAFEEAQKPQDDYIQFETKRVELAQTYADKDANGSPKVHNGQFVIFDKRDEFDAEIKKLKTKFKKAIDARNTQLEEYAKMLDEPVELELSKIKFRQLPPQIESAFLEIFIEAGIIDDNEG